MSGEGERLQKKWTLLKSLDQKHEISRLRLRADVAECIRDCYASGMTRVEIAALLDVHKSRVTALVQGNYRADRPGQVRLNPSNYRLRWVEADVRPVQIETPAVVHGQEVLPRCLYCSDPAKYKVEWEGKSILVCEAHKPPEVVNGG